MPPSETGGTSPETGGAEDALPALAFALSPQGHLLCTAPEGETAKAFLHGEEAGLIHLGGHPAGQGADPTVLFWKSFADFFIRALCRLPDAESPLHTLEAPGEAELVSWILNAPPMRGAEYLSQDVLLGIWGRLAAWVSAEAAKSSGLASFLERKAPAWSRVGRVTLHLAENKVDTECPFAFLATYGSGVSQSGKLSQLPLGKALAEYGGAKNKAGLLRLLTPLHKAAKTCPFLAGLVDSGDIFHPMAWTPLEAFSFLKNIPLYEDAGLLVRLPNWWKKRGKRPQVVAAIDEKKKVSLGIDAMLECRVAVEVDGKKLSEAEIAELLEGAGGLVSFRGEWIEVDREKLQQALEHWKEIAEDGEISFIEGMRLLAGAPRDFRDKEEWEEQRKWAFAQPGEQLAATLRQLANPRPAPPPPSLLADLRPYQASGLDWLWFCARSGFGACLADDMGLGKTVQVLAALLRKKESSPASGPSLLVVPASLIGNWKREAEKFAPSLQLLVVHRSELDTALAPTEGTLLASDLVITTYGMLSRLDWPTKRKWAWVILDEAQAIKNYASGQSKAVRRLSSSARIALTGTPVENNLGDLWSLFDFLNPGLLGTAGQFKTFVSQISSENSAHYAPLRRLVSPYILRRLKTDKKIIADLPEKTEMKVYCTLSPEQAKAYQQTANSLEKDLENAEGIGRRGLVLSYLMRFKQICNHPDQLTKSGAFAPSQSGKFRRLGELCAEIASRGEKVLIFTQFREMTDPLDTALASVFGRNGLILHGATPVKERQKLVEVFQRENTAPYFILSLKAGGTGLNLTAASHVIHFDRWWNPAVENQATDRAFRIGQKRTVLVHKFITSGTLEEKIDALIEAKQSTADAILEGGAEKALTEMDDSELLDFIRLDITRANL